MLGKFRGEHAKDGLRNDVLCPVSGSHPFSAIGDPVM